MPEISSLGINVPASPIRKLAPLANQARAKGVRVLGLNIGQPDLPTPPQAFEALRDIENHRKVLEYSPSDGLQKMREQFAAYYGRYDIHVTPDQIITTTGGSEAVLLAFQATLNPGDELILPEPAYANYVTLAKEVGANIVGIPSSIESGFALPTVEQFEKAITPRTKGILICNPNNPTGGVYTPEELKQLRDVVKKYNLWLYSDEVYREFNYTSTPVMSALQLDGIDDNVIVMDSVSKRYNECGVRLGDLVTRNKALHDVIMKFCQARLSPPLIGQLIAIRSIDCSPEYLKDAFAEYRRRRDILVNGINEIPGVFSPMPMGAFYTVAQLPVPNAEDFCKWCLTDFEYKGVTVFMAPAAGFYTVKDHPMNQVRMAYVLCDADLRLAIEALRAALETYPHTIR